MEAGNSLSDLLDSQGGALGGSILERQHDADKTSIGRRTARSQKKLVFVV
jgi:hypothetical protein